MDNISNRTVPTFRRSLRYFGPHSNNSYLIFIHDLRSWSKQRLMDFLQNHPSKQIFQSISKKYSPTFGIYFIIIIDGSNPLKAMLFLPLLGNTLPIKSKISWKHIEKFTNNRSYNIKHSIKSSIEPISDDFFSSHLKSNSSLFNLCACWNINGWNSEKKDGVMYFNYVFKPVCICLQEIGNS